MSRREQEREVERREEGRSARPEALCRPRFEIEHWSRESTFRLCPLHPNSATLVLRQPDATLLTAPGPSQPAPVSPDAASPRLSCEGLPPACDAQKERERREEERRGENRGAMTAKVGFKKKK